MPHNRLPPPGFVRRPHGFSCARALVAGLCLAAAQPALFGHPDLDERERALSARIQQNPADAELLVRRADVRRLHQEFDLALADLDSAARLRPGWPAVSLARARVLADAGQPRAAIQAADECLAAQPGHGEALLVRARCRVQLGVGREVVADYHAALARLTDTPPDLFLERARLQASLGLLQEAVEGLDEAERRLGPVPAIELAAIEYARQRGDFSGALARLDRAAARSPLKESWLATKGEVLEQAGRLAEAETVFTEALNGIAGYSAARRNAVLTQQLEQRLREARARAQGKLAAQQQASLPRENARIER